MEEKGGWKSGSGYRRTIKRYTLQINFLEKSMPFGVHFTVHIMCYIIREALAASISENRLKT